MSHGELISGFLKRPQIPLGTGYSSGNPHVPCCCSSCSSLWLITAQGNFLCIDLIKKLFFISWPYHSFSHLFLLTFLHLTELNCLVCSVFITDPSSADHACFSHSPSQCAPPSWVPLFSQYSETSSSGFKCPGGMCIGKMTTEFGKCLLKQWSAVG